MYSKPWKFKGPNITLNSGRLSRFTWIFFPIEDVSYYFQRLLLGKLFYCNKTNSWINVYWIRNNCIRTFPPSLQWKLLWYWKNITGVSEAAFWTRVHSIWYMKCWLSIGKKPRMLYRFKDYVFNLEKYFMYLKYSTPA